MLTKKRLALAGVAAAAVAGTVLLFTVFTGGASAGQSGVLDDGKDLLPQAQITLAEAIAAAQTAGEGGVGEVDLEYWNGKLVFNVDLGDQDVKVDATTGEVIGSEHDDN